MICAVVKNDLVENVIVIDEANIPSMEKALQCELVDARPYGLVIGDLRTKRGWTRNAGGEQMVLPLLEQESYDSYTIASERIVALEEENAIIGDITISEAMNILLGEEDDIADTPEEEEI